MCKQTKNFKTLQIIIDRNHALWYIEITEMKPVT
jgi:hypothetical protein